MLPNGQTLTESAAITLYLADMTGRDDFVPPPDSEQRPEFLRWLIFLVANVYPTYTYADEPDRFVPDAAARDGFRATVDAYAQRLYRILEAQARTPWFRDPAAASRLVAQFLRGRAVDPPLLPALGFYEGPVSTAAHTRFSSPCGSCRIRHPSVMTCRVPVSTG